MTHRWKSVWKDDKKVCPKCKELKHKNIQKVGTYNLIEISILQAKLIFGENCQVYVSTESELIKDNIKIFNIYNIIDRPEELATDTAKTIDVISDQLGEPFSRKSSFVKIIDRQPIKSSIKAKLN